MTCQVYPSKAYGYVTAPPSKSMAHRLLICSGLCKGSSVIHGISQSKDIEATLRCLKALGAKVEICENDVKINGIDFNTPPHNPMLDCGESGSTIRFFVPISLLTGNETKLIGAPSLLRRPMDVYKDLSKQHGFEFYQDEKGISVKNKLKNGIYTVPGNVSSQFITGLLFSLPLLDGDSTINLIPPVESYSYLKLTLKALEEFGIEIIENDYSFFIKGKQNYIPRECFVEGDYSNAAFLDAFNYLGGNVTVDGLDENSLQGDKVYKKFFPMLENDMPTIDITDCPDLGPVLFAMAAAKSGAIFTGTKRLRIKESDRVATMAEELSKFNVKIKAEDNSVTVFPSSIAAPTSRIYGHNDHRIVMAMTLLLSITGGIIEGCDAVSKSFPDFFDKIKSLGIGVVQTDVR